MNNQLKLLALIIKNTELYNEFKKFDVIITDPAARYLLDAINEIIKVNNVFNYQLIINYITEKKDFDIYKLYEIIESEDNAENFKIYISELLKQKMTMQLKNAMFESEKKNYIDYKNELTEILNNIKDTEEKIVFNNKDICRKIVDKLRRDYKPEKIPSCIEFIDMNQGGFDPAESYMFIGAEESCGKTSYIYDRINKQLEKGLKVGFVECESSREKVFQLLACNRSGINSNKVDMNQLTNVETEHYMRAIEWLYEKELYVIEDVYDLQSVLRIAKILKKEKNIDVFYVDYLHFLEIDDKKNENEQLKIASREFKKLNRKLRIPIICVVILTKDGRKSGEPQMWQVFGNSKLAYDADITILMACRIEAIDGDFSKRLIDFFVRKNRNGKKGLYSQIFYTDVRRFADANDIEI